MYPCVRESLLMGIGGGFGVGGVRALLGGTSLPVPSYFCFWLVLRGIVVNNILVAAPIPKAANWAVGTFAFAALANYEFCLYKRRIERQHMKRAVEIIDRKKVQKEAEVRKKREERRAAKEAEDRKAEEAAKKKGSWKLW